MPWGVCFRLSVQCSALGVAVCLIVTVPWTRNTDTPGLRARWSRGNPWVATTKTESPDVKTRAPDMRRRSPNPNPRKRPYPQCFGVKRRVSTNMCSHWVEQSRRVCKDSTHWEKGKKEKEKNKIKKKGKEKKWRPLTLARQRESRKMAPATSIPRRSPATPAPQTITLKLGNEFILHQVWVLFKGLLLYWDLGEWACGCGCEPNCSTKLDVLGAHVSGCGLNVGESQGEAPGFEFHPKCGSPLPGIEFMERLGLSLSNLLQCGFPHACSTKCEGAAPPVYSFFSEETVPYIAIDSVWHVPCACKFFPNHSLLLEPPALLLKKKMASIKQLWEWAPCDSSHSNIAVPCWLLFMIKNVVLYIMSKFYCNFMVEGKSMLLSTNKYLSCSNSYLITE